MGKPVSNTIRHFSHQHPLSPLSPDPHYRSPSSKCAACDLKLSALPSYTCSPCGFNLHLKCSELPQQINHPFDKNHLLSLTHSQRRRFTCNACNKDGYGFAYHCQNCEINLHTVCAHMPSRVTHQFHPQHQLLLTFSLSQSRASSSNSFTCCICREVGSNSWLYSCHGCQFHAHLLCARRRVSNPMISQQPSSSSSGNFGSGYVNFPPVQQPVIGTPGPGFNPYYSSTGSNSLIKRIISEMINNAASNISQNPSQISQLYELLGPMSMGGGGGPGFYSGDGSGLGSGFAGFDPSVFAVDPSVFTGFDPTLLCTLFSGLGFFM